MWFMKATVCFFVCSWKNWCWIHRIHGCEPEKIMKLTEERNRIIKEHDTASIVSIESNMSLNVVLRGRKVQQPLHSSRYVYFCSTHQSTHHRSLFHSEVSQHFHHHPIPQVEWTSSIAAQFPFLWKTLRQQFTWLFLFTAETYIS